MTHATHLKNHVGLSLDKLFVKGKLRRVLALAVGKSRFYFYL